MWNWWSIDRNRAKTVRCPVLVIIHVCLVNLQPKPQELQQDNKSSADKWTFLPVSIQILSEPASTAPKAQQEPQSDWSRISWMDLQLGHCLRESKEAGISATSKPVWTFKGNFWEEGTFKFKAPSWPVLNKRWERAEMKEAKHNRRWLDICFETWKSTGEVNYILAMFIFCVLLLVSLCHLRLTADQGWPAKRLFKPAVQVALGLELTASMIFLRSASWMLAETPKKAKRASNKTEVMNYTYNIQKDQTT